MVKLYTKLQSLQDKVGTIEKDSVNPFYKSNYFDINSLIGTIKPLLAEFKLVVLQPLTHVEDKPAIKTVVIDTESGEKVEEITILPENPDPQKMGSIITYFRRYALQSILLLQAEDDDANKAIKQVTPAQVDPELPPFEDGPQQGTMPSKYPEKIEGQDCHDCKNGTYVKNPKTNKIFCDKKCWLNN